MTVRHCTAQLLLSLLEAERQNESWGSWAPASRKLVSSRSPIFNHQSYSTITVLYFRFTSVKSI